MPDLCFCHDLCQNLDLKEKNILNSYFDRKVASRNYTVWVLHIFRIIANATYSYERYEAFATFLLDLSRK